MVLNQLVIFFIIIYMFESLTVIVQSSFTITVLGREWVRVKRLPPVEMIITSLGICRFCLQWSSVLSNFSSYFEVSRELWITGIIWEFSNILTFWLTSLLAIFYCVKVCSTTHPVFLWLKWRISRLVPWFLLSALVISGVALIPSFIRNRLQMELVFTEHLPTNSTLTERLKLFKEHILDFYKMTVLSIPFLLFLVSMLYLMASLVQHWKQMQRHNTGYSNTSLKAHFTALRSLVAFLFFFAAYFLTVMLMYIGIVSKGGPWFWAWEAIVYAIVSIHSTSLMLSSPTLKKALKIKVWGLASA